MAGTKNYTSGNPSNTPSVTVSSSPITHVEPYTGRLYEEEPHTSGNASASTTSASGDATYVTGNACQDCLNNISIGVAGAGESLFARRESNTFLFKGIKSEGAITVRTSGGSLIIGGSGALPSLEEILATHGSFTDEQRGKVLVINDTGDGIDFVEMGGSSTPVQPRFSDLIDVPLINTQAGKVLTVNSTGTGVEWKTPVVPTSDTVVFNDKTPKLARYLDTNGNAVASMAAAYTTNIGYGDSSVQSALPVGTNTKLNLTGDRLELVGKGISFNAGVTPQFFPATEPTAGQVLGYAGNQNSIYGTGIQLEWITPSAGGSTITKFTSLDDTPSSYANQGGRVVRVKSDGTGLEFVTPSVDWVNVANKPTLFDGAYSSLTGKPTIPTKLVDLSDVPSVSGNNGKVLGLNSSGVVAWVAAGGVTTFAALSDIPTITGNANKVLTVNTAGTGVQWSVAPGSRFTTLSDAPASYTGKAGQVVRVNSTETAVEFAVPTVEWTNVGSKPSFVTTLVQLSDLPAITGNAGRVLGIKASGTGFQWYTLPTSSSGGATSFATLSDVPATYSGAGRALRINGTNDGLEYFDLSSVATAGTFASLTGKPTKISDFDVPAYQNGKVLSVASGALTWVSLPSGGATALSGLADVDLSTAPTNGQVLKFNTTTNKWVAGTVTGGASTLATLSDVNTTGLTNGSIIKYDTATSKWIIGTLPSGGGSSTFVSLTDGPGAFTGNGLKAVRVNSGATALEYVSLATVATTGSYADLSNKPTLFSGSYTDLTNKPVLFDGTYASLTGKPTLATVATTGSYNDLSNKPTIPAATTALSALTTDVLISSPASGQFLSFNGTKWVNVPAPSGGGATALSGLSDVTVSTPATGQVLTYNGTKWVNQTPAASGSTGGSGTGPQHFDIKINWDNNGANSKPTTVDTANSPSGWNITIVPGSTTGGVINVTGAPGFVKYVTVFGYAPSLLSGQMAMRPITAPSSGVYFTESPTVSGTFSVGLASATAAGTNDSTAGAYTLIRVLI